ncbi:MAG: hypothetical protein Q8K70_09850 [Bacteroidota bacterium]|nr:hypothetical protein [Bacteroidota bacterium]
MDVIQLKKDLLSKSNSIVINKLDEINLSLSSINESISTDTKSTAGDKHETFKALMHHEQEKLNHQKGELLKQLTLLNQIKPIELKSISIGAIIKTNLRLFFIGLPVGIIQVNQIEYFSVSINSPIIKAMNISQTYFEFNGLKYQILEIL